MKLLKILARELEEWPEEAQWITQDACIGHIGRIAFFNNTKPTRDSGDDQFTSPRGNCGTGSIVKLATDHATAIITREMWEEARAKLQEKKAMPKTNKYSYRFTCASSEAGRPILILDGPLQWRDRIKSIDASKAAEEDRHHKAMDELNKERQELVQRLEAEGLMLCQGKAASVEPEADMEDSANWKAGDELECITSGSDCYTRGFLYKFIWMATWGSVRTIDDTGTENGMNPECFKWHSRPKP